MAKPPGITALKGLCGLKDALVFRDNVTTTTIDPRRQHCLPGFEICESNISQSPDSGQMRLQELHSLLAIGPAEIVFP
jgi:hypothetical protein